MRAHSSGCCFFEVKDQWFAVIANPERDTHNLRERSWLPRTCGINRVGPGETEEFKKVATRRVATLLAFAAQTKRCQRARNQFSPLYVEAVEKAWRRAAPTG